MDDAPVDWEKQKRIKEAQERARKDLLKEEAKKDKVNQGFLGAKEFGVKPHGFTWDEETIRKNLERLANIGLLMTICAVVYGFIELAVGVMSLGAGFGQIFDAVITISKVVGLLCSGVALVSSIIVIRLKKYKIWNALITAAIAFALYLIYKGVFFAVLSV
ncbi:hypothetical protein IKZ77_02820 [Candidatus Saccharibacteria bacterium]|nr:hypothetical protein [Candidatus Saccharibacteria bacterium]